MCGPARAPLRRRARRACAAVTALLAVLGLLGVQGREAAEIHVRCLEHGELMHVAPAAHGAELARPGTSALGPRSAGDRTGHEHCLFVGANHCVHGSLAIPATTAVATLEVVHAVAPSEHLARATFRLAPKTSPPA